MGSYAAFDVSHKTSHLWIVDEAGSKRWQGACATDPAAMAQVLGRHAPIWFAWCWKRARCRRIWSPVKIPQRVDTALVVSQ